MKKLSLLLILCLLLCGCRAESKPTDNTQPTGEDLPEALHTVEGGNVAPTEETPPAIYALPDESSAWAPYSNYEDVLGLVLNEPVDDPPSYTTCWMEGEYECAYIIPRFIGSCVSLYDVEWNEDYSSYTISDEPQYSTRVGDGCVIYSVLPRPEGFPVYYLEITLPDGRGDGWILRYDGRDGTAPVEFFELKS